MIRTGNKGLVALLLVVIVGMPAFAGSFVMFPQAGRLVSPDGRFEVRDVETSGDERNFVAASHSLWLIDVASGRSRKLCDYLGLAAVSLSGAEFVMVTEYLGKKTSRVLVFSAAGSDEPVVIDAAALIPLLPVEQRPTLRENDHLFVEASSIERRVFHFRAWGYGKHDPNGFRWDCEYSLSGGGGTRCKPGIQTTFQK